MFVGLIPSFRLDDHLTVVLGDIDSEITATLIQALVAQGSEIAIINHNIKDLEETQTKIVQFVQENKLSLPEVSFWELDTFKEEVQEIISQINCHHGKVADKLIYCTNCQRNENENPSNTHLYSIRNNLMGVLCLCHSISQKLKLTKKPGSFLFVTSYTSDSNSVQSQAAYEISHTCVTHLTRSLAGELAPHGIRINSITSGVVSNHTTHNHCTTSPATARATCKPQDLVGAMLYFLSDSASRYTTGEDLLIDGGSNRL